MASNSDYHGKVREVTSREGNGSNSLVWIALSLAVVSGLSGCSKSHNVPYSPDGEDNGYFIDRPDK